MKEYTTVLRAARSRFEDRKSVFYGLCTHVTTEDEALSFIAAAKKEGADYAVDVYPHYGSDVEATLAAGNDVRHGLIGSGVYASHGYERSHKDGVMNTLLVLKGYLGI